MNDFIQVAQELSPGISAIAGILAGALATYTVARVVKFSSSVRDLEKNLRVSEEKYHADLSDTTDRELRKILVHISHCKANLPDFAEIREEKYKKYFESDIDFIVFVDAFRGLQSDNREIFCERIEKTNLFEQADFLRVLLRRSHNKASDHRALKSSVGLFGNPSLGRGSYASLAQESLD